MNSHHIEEAIGVVKDPQILINAVSKRVRQLASGSRPMVQSDHQMGLMDIALAEIAQGKLVVQSADGEKL